MSEKQVAVSEREFTLELRDAVERYMLAIDAWETAYQKFYRLPGYADQVSDDLAQEHREYLETRRRLEALLPRARGLCFKHGLRDPFASLVHVALGQHAPQQRNSSALGRSERMAVNDCLMQLAAACQEWAAAPESTQTETESPAAPSQPKRNLLRRLIDYLY